MKVEQIAIFLENKSGRLSEITGVLADNNINIRSLSLADTADFGILRLIVDKVEKAERVLKEGGFTVGKTNVIAVEVPDRVGGLASVLKVLEKAQLNVEYMYAFVNKSGENAVMIFRFEETDEAIKILQDAGITILSGAQICAL
ncbi:MAG: ACT domain-containing protein [Desulfocapsaceae bacterium]|nr:ACT domain-containing protein [Desulfocapsaceae bacterium]